jgi:hypothetical protein
MSPGQAVQDKAPRQSKKKQGASARRGSKCPRQDKARQGAQAGQGEAPRQGTGMRPGMAAQSKARCLGRAG